MNSALLEERKERILKAIALEETDRTPVVLEYAGFAPRVTGHTLGEFVGDLRRSAEIMMEAWDKVGGADAVEYPSYTPANLAFLWMSKVLVPGVDLPEDQHWQVLEQELMKPEDYDAALEMGWMEFVGAFMTERISGDVMLKLMEMMQLGPELLKLWHERGVPVIMTGVATTPYEMLCGARTLANLVMDMYRNGDMVQKVMDAALPFMAPQMIAMTQQLGMSIMWIGGWRGASEILAKPLWERFVWPYLEKIAFEVLDAGLIPWFHLDSDWTRDLEKFKVFPKGKCAIAFDGATDIRKAKEILGDRMCIVGDVPPALLTLGTPDEVHEYCTRLIADIGPTGFILQSGCDIPTEAKLENVQAMVAAATGK